MQEPLFRMTLHCMNIDHIRQCLESRSGGTCRGPRHHDVAGGIVAQSGQQAGAGGTTATKTYSNSGKDQSDGLAASLDDQSTGLPRCGSTLQPLVMLSTATKCHCEMLHAP